MDDWNEALMYMSNREARYSSFTAKEEILEFLKSTVYKGLHRVGI